MKTAQHSAPRWFGPLWAAFWYTFVLVVLAWFMLQGPLVRGADFTVTSNVRPAFVVESRIAGPDESQAAPAGLQWVKRGDGPWKLERLETAAPAVAAPATFPAFDRSHNCPQCGRKQTAINRFLPNGQHEHVCAAGHAWVH